MMQQDRSSGIPWPILGSAWLMAFAVFSPIFCVPPMEHILKEELLLTHTQTSLLYIAPVLMLAVLAIPGGIIADRIGVKKAAGIGAIIVAVGTILRGTATDSSTLLVFTFIYGLGFGLSVPNLPKLVSAWVPQEKAGMAMGILSSGLLVGTALALAITMPLIFPITNTFQGVFLIWSIPTIVAAILWWMLVREPERDSIHNAPASIEKTPLRQVLGNKNLWMVAFLFMLHNFYFYTWTGWVPTLMMQKGATPELAGLITSITVWVGILTVFLMPRLAYKLGLRKPFLWAPSIVLALVAWGAIYVTIPMSWLLMALVGVANMTRFSTLLALPIEMSPEEEVGTASGLTLSGGYTGGVIGALTGGRILDLTGSLDLSFLILTGVSIVATGIAFSLPETGIKPGSKK